MMMIMSCCIIIWVIGMSMVTGLNLSSSSIFLALDLSAVEIAVAITSRAPQCFRGVLLSARHEFPTPVDHVTTRAGRVIFQTLSILNQGRGRGGRRR